MYPKQTLRLDTHLKHLMELGEKYDKLAIVQIEEMHSDGTISHCIGGRPAYEMLALTKATLNRHVYYHREEDPKPRRKTFDCQVILDWQLPKTDPSYWRRQSNG